MPEEITNESVQEKIDRGEDLTAAENKFVMGGPAVVGDEQDPDGSKKEEEYEDIDPDKEDKDDKDKDKKEDTPSSEKKDEKDKDKKEDTSASQKKDEGADTDTGKDKAGVRKEDAKPEDTRTLAEKIKEEIDKPDGQENLTDYSAREKGLFFELRATRKRAQKAEEDLDVAQFETKKKAKTAETAKIKTDADKEAEKAEEKLKAILEGEEDWVSKKDLKEILALIKPKAAEKVDTTEIEAVNRKAFTRQAEMNARDIIEIRREKDKDIPDYDEVLKYAPEIIEGNDAYGKKIAEAMVKGKNPAMVIYDLIRKDEKFKTLHTKGTKKEDAKPEDKSKEGKQTLDKINKNLKKAVTSGTQGGGGGDDITDSKGNKYTLMQLIKMPSSEFRKVPKEVRKKFLEQG